MNPGIINQRGLKKVMRTNKPRIISKTKWQIHERTDANAQNSQSELELKEKGQTFLLQPCHYLCIFHCSMTLTP